MRPYFLSFLLSVLLFSCSEDITVVDPPNVPNYGGITIDSNVKAWIRHGEPRVKISGPAALMDFLHFEITGPMLYIGLEPGALNPGNDVLTAEIYLPNLDSLIVLGSGIAFMGQLAAMDDLRLRNHGSGAIIMTAPISVNNLRANIEGSGNIYAAGETLGHHVFVSGSGHYLGYQMASSSIVAGVSDIGNAYIRIDGPLDVTISGSGSVYYKGDAYTITQYITGEGSLIDAN